MDQESQLQQLHDQLFLEVGKCVLVFQQIEGMLKRLLPVAAGEGFASEWKEILENRAKEFAPSTLGMLIGAFKREMLVPLSKGDEPQAEVKEIYFSFRLVVSEDETYLATKRDSQDRLVKDRNNLVHHFHSSVQWDSWSNVSAALADVAAMRKRAMLERAFFVDLLKQLNETATIQNQLFETGFWEAHVEPFILGEPELPKQLKENE